MTSDTNTAIVLSDAGYNLTDYSFACKFRATSSPGAARFLFYKGNSASKEPISIYLSNGTLVMEYYNAGPNYYTNLSAPSLEDGQWHSAVCVRKVGVKMFIYVDGSVYARSQSLDTGNTTTVTNLARFLSRGNTTFGFLGEITDMFVWNRDLSEQEALRISQGESPTLRRDVMRNGGFLSPGAKPWFYSKRTSAVQPFMAVN